MAVVPLVWDSFEGGWSTDSRIGLKNSHAYSQGLDFRKNPSQLSVLPGLTREDGGVCKDLILNEVMVNDGTIYAFGNAGYFYKRTTSGIWAVEGKLSSGASGIDYRKDTDSIYLASAKAVSLYTPVTGLGTSSLVPNNFASSYSTYDNSTITGFNVAAYQSGSVLTTAIAVATTPLNETAGNIRYFQSDIEPLVKISVYIVSKGTGDWTLTLHDGLNNVLGSATVANASLKSNDWNDFTFTTAPNGQVRIYVAPNARTYHVHITSTVANGTVSSKVSNDLSSCDLQVWADRLIQTNNGLHPIQRFLQYELIGNANYVSIWEPLSSPPTNAEWKRHGLVFPREYEVCGITVQDKLAVITLEQNTTTSGTPQSGLIAYWDGTSDTYNDFVPVPEGSPYNPHTYKNILQYYASGSKWQLPSAYTQPVKSRTMPGSDTEFSQTTVAQTPNIPSIPLMSSLTDNFNGSGSQPDPTKWDGFGNYSQANGVLQLKTNTTAGSNGLTSHIAYQMFNSSLQIRVLSAGNQALTSVEVFPLIFSQNAANQMYWYINQNVIKAISVVTNVTTTFNTAPFNLTTFQYLRIRELNGTIYWDYSADGVNWMNFASRSTPTVGLTLGQDFAGIQIGNFNTEATTTTALFDDFNIVSGVSPITIYPYASTVRRNTELMAYPSVSTSLTVPFGVYSYGAVDKNYDDSFGLDYVISTGSTAFTPTNNLQLGMVQSFGDLLHVSWRDDSAGGYGVDVVSNSSRPATYAKWQSRVYDGGYAAKEKTALWVEAYYQLPVGVSIRLSYSIDGGTWISDPKTYSSTSLWNGKTNYCRFNITQGRFREVQAQFELTGDNTVTTPGVVQMVALVTNDNREEELA
jgi:hypothetical protein